MVIYHFLKSLLIMVIHKMRIDLHGYRLEEAIEEIFWKVEEGIIMEDNELGIIHGYHHGQVLKNFFRSQKFREEMHNRGYEINRIGNKQDPGYTAFKVKIK